MMSNCIVAFIYRCKHFIWLFRTRIKNILFISNIEKEYELVDIETKTKIKTKTKTKNDNNIRMKCDYSQEYLFNMV